MYQLEDSTMMCDDCAALAINVIIGCVSFDMCLKNQNKQVSLSQAKWIFGSGIPYLHLGTLSDSQLYSLYGIAVIELLEAEEDNRQDVTVWRNAEDKTYTELRRRGLYQ